MSPPKRRRPAETPDRPAPDVPMPAVVPLLSPLTPHEQMLHQVRNHLTFIAGTAHGLRRRLERGEIDPQQEADRLERLERAVWAVDALLAESDS